MDAIIETGVDRLIELVKKKGKISFPDAAEKLGVGISLVEEWSDFLEDEGLISIQYKLTTPYLVERKLTKKDTLTKAKEFYERKDTFISKAEAMLSVIEKESKELQSIKSLSDHLRKNLGLDLDKVNAELQELEKYEKLKDLLHKRILEKEQEFRVKMEELTSQILNEQKKYENLLKSVEEEESKIEKEKLYAKSIEEKEELLLVKLKEFERMIGNLRNAIKDEYKEIFYSEKHTKELKRLADTIKSDIAKQKTNIFELLGEREKKERKIMRIQDEISKKIYESAENVTTARKASKAFRDFFEKKMQIGSMIDKLNQNREELRGELAELIRKARSFQLAAKTGDVSQEILDIQNKFNEIDNKKNLFEIELRKFMSLIIQK